MKFESAHALKEEALSRFIEPPGGLFAAVGDRLRASNPRLTAAVARASDIFPDSFGFPTIRTDPSFGLGVAVSPAGDCKLAVRYPWLDRSRAPHLAELKSMAHNEIDVAWTGPIKASSVRPCGSFQSRRRPVTIGSSIAHDGGTAGTLCAFVQRGGGAPEMLSCNHVFADCDRVQPNTAILQPGPGDGGQSKDLVGRLAYAYPFVRDAVNVVDCAVATLETGVISDHSTLEGYGNLAGLVEPEWYAPNTVGEVVAKIGRTTGATQGRVTALAFTSEIEYSVGYRVFTDLIEIESANGPFGRRGDSGSMVFTINDRLGAGMIIAVAEVSGKTYMTRIDTVLSRLGAQLVT